MMLKGGCAFPGSCKSDLKAQKGVQEKADPLPSDSMVAGVEEEEAAKESVSLSPISVWARI